MSIMFVTRGEAEDVLNHLISICDLRGVVTVGDLYNLASMSTSYTEENWGWRDLRNARVVHISSGYILDLPKPEDIRVNDDQVTALYNSMNEKEYSIS